MVIDFFLNSNYPSLVAKSWMDHECLKYSKSTELSCEESSFFRALIQKCLYPLRKDKDQEQKEAALRQLRNNSFFAIFMLNAGWIGFIFTLTLLKVFSVFFYLISRGYWNVFFQHVCWICWISVNSCLPLLPVRYYFNWDNFWNPPYPKIDFILNFW